MRLKRTAPILRAFSRTLPSSRRTSALSQALSPSPAHTNPSHKQTGATKQDTKLAGANAASRGLGAKPSVGAKLGNWFRTQQEHGADLVAKIDFQDATVIAVIGAVMSYKERKMVALVTQAVGSFIKLYLLMLFVRVLLTWFPNVDWMRQPWAILRQVTDPYLNLFRNLIPPIMGQIDFTPILGFMVLQFLAKVLSSDPSVGRF